MSGPLLDVRLETPMLASAPGKWGQPRRRSSSFSQGRKKNPNPNFSVRMFSGGVRVFHVKGWGPKSSVCPSKARETKLFAGISRDFAGISRGRPKSMRKRGVCSILVPYFDQIPYKPLKSEKNPARIRSRSLEIMCLQRYKAYPDSAEEVKSG